MSNFTFVTDVFSAATLLMIDSWRNDENFLISLLMFGALFFFFAAVIGVALIIIFAMVVFFLISGGVITTSILVGFQQKSTNKGFKTFFILICGLGTIAVSVIFFLLINAVQNWWSKEIAIFIGISFGGISGWILGLMMFFAFKKITVFLKQKFVSMERKP